MALYFPSLPHVEDCRKRIRTFKAGVCIFDTTKAKMVWLHPFYPSYYFPKTELTYWYLTEAESDENSTTYDVWLGGDPKAARSVVLYLSGPLAGLASVKFDAMDAWFEEDEQIFFHPRDPYKRLDILPSSRHVRIEVNGIELANSKSIHLVFETGLPVRTYFPMTECKMELWQPSTKVTGCPYKGEARYYNVVLASGEVFENILWYYPFTTAESIALRGMVAFFDEKVDVWVDGEKQERPVTGYSD